MIVVYEEADDPSQAMERMMASDSEYAHWIVQHVLPLLDTDQMPASEILADWRA